MRKCKYNITKETLEKYLKFGWTNSQIANAIGCSSKNVNYFIHKYGI